MPDFSETENTDLSCDRLPPIKKSNKDYPRIGRLKHDL